MNHDFPYCDATVYVRPDEKCERWLDSNGLVHVSPYYMTGTHDGHYLPAGKFMPFMAQCYQLIRLCTRVDVPVTCVLCIGEYGQHPLGFVFHDLRT